MPHGKQIILPFLMATIAFVINFRIFTSCDLVKTEWSTNCSKPGDEYCVHITDINMGFLCKWIYCFLNGIYEEDYFHIRLSISY
jgi:hypothetical protein